MVESRRLLKDKSFFFDFVCQSGIFGKSRKLLKLVGEGETMKKVIFWGMCIMLVGCAKAYVVPSSGPMATMKIKTESPFNNLPVTRYLSDDCSEESRQRITLLNSKAIGTAYSPEAVITIAASQKFIFSVYSLIDMSPLESGKIGYQYRWCSPVVEFFPEDGVEYFAKHSVAGNCSIEIFRVDKTGSLVPDPTAKVHSECSQVMVE